VKHFASLYMELDGTTKTNEKIAALTRYFSLAPPEDAVWAVHFLIGRRPRQLVPTRKLCEWATVEAGVPGWLFEESYEAVGDLAETVALLLPAPAASSDLPLHYWIEQRLLLLRDQQESRQRESLLLAWRELDASQRFVWNKLITGEFRVGVFQKLVIRGLSKASGVKDAVLAHRLMGDWDPTPEFYRQLVLPETRDTDVSRPYPFFLAYPLEGEVQVLGDPGEWQVEWKWDGIRAQLIRRNSQVFVWSRGEELVTDRFPELSGLGKFLPDGTVIDGEIVAWKDERPLLFGQLQRRIGRKDLNKKILSEVPVVLLAYDLLEDNGEDVRGQELRWRRERLEGLANQIPATEAFRISASIKAQNWEEWSTIRQQARQHSVEGLMLKRLASPYGVGRQRGDWWKWKVEPFSVDAVLIYAQRGHGRRASLYTDYTFGVWEGDHLVPFAKAYSGLTDEEIRQVDAFVRRNTLEKFGPVRTVKPELVFELAFEAIRRSSRHKSGFAVRFPRMARWRTDKKIEEADSLDTIRAFVEG
jgi:ATP-dependent DNA ligase